MAQLFKPYANSLARMSVLALGLVPVLGFYAGSTISRSAANTKAGVALTQPVKFSHKHHAMELGISCLFCHTNVEKSGTAGIPPTETCMTCHSQIWTNSPELESVRKSFETGMPIKFVDSDQVGWNQVNKVPEFVYFNHSIHIERGINCNYCHGPIQEMQMTYKNQAFSMEWCLDCHRNPEKALYKDGESASPKQQVFNLYRKIQAGDKLSDRESALAHGKKYTPTPEELAKGEELLNEYQIKKKQLMDCWVCHR
jgi:hypothetical protein